MKLSSPSRMRGLGVLAAAILASAGAQAQTSTTLYGGGATLVGTAISGVSWFENYNPPLRGIVGDPGSLAGQYTASTSTSPFPFFKTDTQRPQVFYCQTGSGRGKQVLNNQVPASNECGNYGQQQNGFGAPLGRKADFAATDSPYSQTEFNTFLTNEGATRTQPVQFPFVTAVLGIIYNNSDAPAEPITLTELQVCKIFAGEITNWRQISKSFPSKKIIVTYRGDSSGTSFAMSNHLSAVCADPDIGGVVTGFKTTQTFGGNCVGATPMTCTGTGAWPVAAPPLSVAAPGNGAVTVAVANTDGALGFADVADTNERIKLDPSIQLKFALLSRKAGTNPATGKRYKKLSPVNHPKNFRLQNLLTDTVTSGINANGRPVKVPLTNPPQPGCILLADPDGYATAALDANGDYESYPIVGVSYLAAGATGNGVNRDNLRAFLFSPFTGGKAGTYSEGITTIGAKSGYMFVTGLPDMNAFISNCVKR